MASVDPDIHWYYNKGREAGRLNGPSQLEGHRTLSILSRWLPQDELEEAGFENILLLPIEGPWYTIPSFELKRGDPDFRWLLLKI